MTKILATPTRSSIGYTFRTSTAHDIRPVSELNEARKTDKYLYFVDTLKKGGDRYAKVVQKI